MEVINGNEAGTELTVTSVADLESYAKGVAVRFADFADGQPLVARVRRPSMLALAKSGRIPNELLSTAATLFSQGAGSAAGETEGNVLADLYNVCHAVCDAALIEPTLKQIEDAGMELSDDQFVEIFNYTQVGVKALKSFRRQ